MQARKNVIFELNKTKTSSLTELTNGYITCQKDSVSHDEAEMCKCWNIGHLLSMNAFHYVPEDRTPPRKPLDAHVSEFTGSLTVRELVRKFKAKWLADRVPDGHSACQLFVVDQIEELENAALKALPTSEMKGLLR